MSDTDDQESVDRAFAELIAGFHLTAEHHDPPPWEPRPDRTPDPGSVFETPWTLPDPEPPPPEPPPLPELPEPEPAGRSDENPAGDPLPTAEERFDPGPPPPLPRPAWPVLIGWIGLGYAILTVLAIAVGIDLPAWAAWAGIVGFVGGFGLLVSRLPRQRPPDAGDGAVL